MSKLGGLYYEITLKDSTNTGLSAIEKKIKNLSTSISPKITSAGLNGQLKEASKSLNPVNVAANITLNKDSKTNLINSIKGAVASGKIKVNFEAYVESLRTSIRNAVNGATYKATIDARVRELQTSIRNAINAGDYKAKIAADTTLLAGAIQRQINQQTFTAKVTLTSQSATTDKKKKSEEVTNTKTKKRKDEPIKITVDASSAPKTIQTAIDSKDYKAKVGADTTQLVDAINKAIPQEKTIKINGTVVGGNGTTGGSNSGKKSGNANSDNSAKAVQREAERQQKAYYNHLNQMQNMRLTYEKDKRKLGLYGHEPIKYTSKLGTSDSINKTADVIARKTEEYKKAAGRIAEEIARIQGRISTQGNFASPKDLQNLGSLRQQLDLYLNQLRKLDALSNRVQKVPQATITYTHYNKTMGSGKTPYNHEAEQRKWEEHFAWRDRTTGFTKSGRMLSVDELAKIQELKGHFSALSKRIETRRDAVQGLLSSASSKNDSNAIKYYTEQLERLESLLGRVQRMSQNATFALPRMRSLDGYGSVPSNHAEMQKKWEAHFAWKDELAAQEKSKRAEEARVAAIKAAVEQRKQAAASARQYATEMQRVASEFQNVGNKGGWLRDQLQNVFSMYGVQQFLQNLIMIGGEFEKQKIALGSIFKNTAKGNETFEQIKQWSVKSPFTFSNLTAYTKQLASFGFQYRDVFETTKKLADISAGVGVDMGRVILAYGQVFTAHYLRGQELRQFTEAGIPMVDELSKVLTERMGKQVNAGDVFKLISDKQVEFEDVKKVIDKLTGEGGTFYKMQEKQSESLAGRWTNLKDAVEIMYSDIESADNGVLKGSVSLLTKLALHWKGVGTAVLSVVGAYGLLALKNRVVFGAASKDAALIASMNAKKAAIDSQAVSYNQLANAIAKKNYNENQATVGANVGYHGSLNMYSRGEAKAATRYAQRLALGGTPLSEITPLYSGATKEYRKPDGSFGFVGKIDEKFKNKVKAARELYLKIEELKKVSQGGFKGVLDGNTWKLWGLQAKSSLTSVGLSLKAFGASMMATMASMLPFMAISAAIGAAFSWYQSSQEEKQKQKDFADGAKASYKEVMDFIDGNPIQVKVEEGNYSEIKQLIEKYKEEARNAPINIDFAITEAGNISDYGEQLTYLKNKLQEVAEAELYVKENGGGIVKQILDDTGQGWLNDDYAENTKDYIEARDKLNKDLSESSLKNVGGVFKEINKELSKKNIAESYRKELILLRAELSKLYAEGNNREFWYKVLEHGIIERKSYNDFKSAESNKNEDAGIAFDDIQKRLSHVDGALDGGKLTDKGHDIMVKIAKGIGENKGLVDEEIDSIIADFEQRSSAAPNSAWEKNSQAANALIDQIKTNCRELFEGQDLSNGFSEQQRQAIQKIINEAPTYCKRFQDEWQRLLNQRTLVQRVAVEMDATGAPGFTPNSAQDVFKRLFPNLANDKAIAALFPKNNVDYGDYVKDLVSKFKTNAEGLKVREYQKDKSPKVKSEYESIQRNQEAVRTVLGAFDPSELARAEEEANKKENQAAAKAQRAKEKAQRDKEKQQRDEEARLQKRFQQIKRVREMYEKLRGLYGDVEAMEKIKHSGLIPADLIPDNVTDMETFLKKYQAIMKKFYNSYKANSENLRNLNSQVAQDLLNIQFDKEKEALDKAVSTLETQLERAGDAWTRYKSLISDGVGKPIANLLAFGFDFGSDSYQTDDSGSQRLKSLREQAARHITEKAVGKSTSEYDMDRYLSMNEDELKTEFGGNEKVTKGLWSIVKAYQEAAKTIRSENDKLIAELYKQSLSYAEQINSITQKHKGERATIKEKRRAYEPAKKELNDALSGQEKAYKNYNDAIALAQNTNEYKFYQKTVQTREEAQQNLDNYRDLSPDKKLNLKKENNITEESLKKVLAEAIQEEKNNKKAYESTAEYTVVQEAEENKKRNDKKVEDARDKLKDTLPPSVADALIAQSKINERNEKSEVSIKELEGSEPYIELFNNIYNLASRTAKDLANDLIDTLDEKLAKGEINTEDYVKARNEISSKRNEVYEKGTDSKNAKLWQVGFGGILKNKIQQSESERNTAGEEMKSLQTRIDQNESTMTTEQKAVQMADLQQKYEQAKTNLNNATNDGDRESYKEEMQNVQGRIDKLNDTETITEDEKSTRRTILGGLYDNAKQRYEEADAQGNQLAKKQAKQDMIQGGFGMAANMGQNLTQFRDTLGGTLDAFGIDTENNEGFQKFSTAVDVMSDVSSGMSNAMQSMMSGDFVGAAFSIIETPMNISNAFAKLHDKKLDIQINQSKELQEEVQTAADELKTAIQDSLGSEDAKNRAMSRQGEMAQILADAGVEDTIGAGLVYSMLSGKKSGSDVISENEHKFYGKDGKVTDNEYRHVFNFGKFLGNTLALGTSTAIGAIPATGYTTYKAVSNSRSVKRNEEAKAFTRMAEALEKAQFGKADSVSVYGAQYAALLEQRKQAEYQMKLEQDKSNTDEDKVKEQRKQIQELNTQIHEYMTNLAKELYGIDFSSWATKLGDALTNAFRNGEDAAAAFHDTVGDIMADLVKNMLITDAIKPMFSKLETTLFGKDGDGSGMLDMNDMEGSIKKAVPYITDFFNQVENSVPGWQQLYDVLDEASGGIVKKTSSSSSSLSGSIKGITEETSTLLASYINAIRLDVSVNRKNIDDLAKVTIPKMSVIAENQLKQLNVIADRATQIEENTRKNSESVEMIRTFLGSVSTTTSGGKAIRFKG